MAPHVVLEATRMSIVEFVKSSVEFVNIDNLKEFAVEEC
jgi:hypothetical protein